MTRMKKSGPFLFFNTRQLSKSNNLKYDIGTAVPLDNFWLKNGWFRPDLPKLAHQIVTVLVPLYPMARNKVKMGTLLWRFGHFTRLTKNAKNAIFQFSTWFLKTFQSTEMGPPYLKKNFEPSSTRIYHNLPCCPTHGRVIALQKGIKCSWTVCKYDRFYPIKLTVSSYTSETETIIRV